MRIPARLTLSAGLLAAACAAHGASLLDTGEPGAANWQSLTRSASVYAAAAASFTVDHATTIAEVEGWMRISKAGELSAMLWSGAPSFGTDPLYSVTRSLPVDSTGHWESFSGLGWAVGPGTYTIAFVPVLGFSGAMSKSAPDPADAYHYYTCFVGVACNSDWLPSNGASPALGFRVDEATAAVPEPAGVALMLAGLWLIALSRSRRAA